MAASASTPCVLLGDVDVGTRETFGKFFSKAGWSCDTVSDGKQLVEAIGQRDYDVIFTDLVMPNLHGIELLRAIRSQKPLQPVVVLTSMCNMDDAISVLREGVVDYLQKPLDFHSLELVLDRIRSGLRILTPEREAFPFISKQVTEYVFTSAELANCKMPLVVVDHLFTAGIIDRDTQLMLILGLQEALANALEHGNLELPSQWKEEFTPEGIDKFSLEKKSRLADPNYAERIVRVRTEVVPHSLTIVIKDSGSGFLEDNGRHKQEASENVLTYGRGVSIIQRAVDEVWYADRGTEITLVKYLQGDK